MVAARTQISDSNSGRVLDAVRAEILVAILHALRLTLLPVDRLDFQLEKQKNRTVYKIVYSGVTEKPEMQFISLKQLVGERGFEPPTPWSRNKCPVPRPFSILIDNY
jgi:hypothetical protein